MAFRQRLSEVTDTHTQLWTEPVPRVRRARKVNGREEEERGFTWMLLPLVRGEFWVLLLTRLRNLSERFHLPLTYYSYCIQVLWGKSGKEVELSLIMEAGTIIILCWLSMEAELLRSVRLDLQWGGGLIRSRRSKQLADRLRRVLCVAAHLVWNATPAHEHTPTDIAPVFTWCQSAAQPVSGLQEWGHRCCGRFRHSTKSWLGSTTKKQS